MIELAREAIDANLADLSRFLGDDMVHAPRRWTTSPPFAGLEDELPAGAPMAHPWFPVLWTAQATAQD